MKPLLRSLLMIAALLGAPVVQAKPLTLRVEAMRQLAYTALQAGFAEQALVYTDGLLQRDPKDATALIIRAQALRELGRYGDAQTAAKAAWRAAQTDNGKFGAALAAAQALSSDGRRTAAQFWLRRAAQVAPSPRAFAMARQSFDYVKSRNPWVFGLDASAAPSSNVNNGSSNTKMTIGGLPILFDIPPESRALSGGTYGLGLSATYRFSPKGPNRQTEARIGLIGSGVVLSGAAKAAAPAARAADFSYQAVEFGLSHSRGLGTQGRTALRLSGTVGHNWYGGGDLSNYLRLSMGVDRALATGGQLSFGLSADHTARVDRPIQSSDRVAVQLGYATALGQDRLTLQIEAAKTFSDSDEVRNVETSVSVDWKKAQPVAGIGLSAGLEIAQRRFADSHYALGGRDDLSLSADLRMSFDKIGFMGFSPVLTLSAKQNRSNTAQNESDDLGMLFGIKSSF